MTEQELKAFDQMREKIEKALIYLAHSGKFSRSGAKDVLNEALTAANAVSHPQATKPAGWKLIGWRTADYLLETNDPKMAKNWEVHYEILPIFEGDANTKLAAAPEEKH